MITKREAAVIQMFTGKVMLTGEDLRYFYEYAEELIGRPVYTHEFPRLKNILTEKSRSDFINLCKNLIDNDAEPVVHAHWNKPYWGGSKQECSNCHCTADLSKQGRAYCSYCGAKMDEEVHNA